MYAKLWLRQSGVCVSVNGIRSVYTGSGAGRHEVRESASVGTSFEEAIS